MLRLRVRETLDRLVEPFCLYLSDQGKSAATVACYRGDVRSFLESLRLGDGDLARICEVGVREASRFREGLARSLKPATANRKLSALKAFFHWAGCQGLIDQHSVPHLEHFRALRQQRRKTTILTKTEQARLLRIAQKGDDAMALALIALMLTTGIRVSEIHLLSWKDVDFREDFGTVTVRNSKSAKKVTHSLDKVAIKALHMLQHVVKSEPDCPVFTCRSRPITRQQITTILERYFSAAGLQCAHPNALRATFEAELLNEGMDPYLLAYTMGYSRLNAPQDRYSKYCLMKRSLRERSEKFKSPTNARKTV